MALLHEKMDPKDWHLLFLGDAGFLQFLRVVSSDYSKPRSPILLAHPIAGGASRRLGFDCWSRTWQVSSYDRNWRQVWGEETKMTLKNVGVSKNSGTGTPKIIHFNRDFHDKSSILGYPYFWKHPGGGFKYVLFSPLLGEMILFDKYFSKGLKPPTSCNLSM